LVDSLRHEFNNIGEANIVEKLKWKYWGIHYVYEA
jgi:hypothetical protein